MTDHQVSAISSELENEERVRKVEILISNLLRVGVLLSLALIVGGTILSLVRHPEYLSQGISFRNFIGSNDPVAHSLSEVVAGLASFSGQSIVTVGIVFLIATPVMRVGVSIFTFIYQHDRLYVLITTTVFSLLLLSFVLGKAE